jgi:hypothetical protein
LAFFSSLKVGCRVVLYEWPFFSFSTKIIVH